MSTALGEESIIDLNGATVASLDSGTIHNGHPTVKIIPDPSVPVIYAASPVYFDSPAPFTISLFVKANNGTNWISNPTASELYFELSVLDKVVKSATSINFTSNTEWQQITANFSPIPGKVGKLSLFYNKLKEDGVDNVFWFDPVPIIS